MLNTTAIKWKLEWKYKSKRYGNKIEIGMEVKYYGNGMDMKLKWNKYEMETK